MKKKKIKPCLIKQLLNMFKLWCEWGIRLINAIDLFTDAVHGDRRPRTKKGQQNIRGTRK